MEINDGDKLVGFLVYGLDYDDWASHSPSDWAAFLIDHEVRKSQTGPAGSRD